MESKLSFCSFEEEGKIVSGRNSLVPFLLRGSINQEELLKRAAWAVGVSEVSKI